VNVFTEVQCYCQTCELHFRIQPIVILADIKKEFLQVGIQEMDRDATGFLWFKDLKSLDVVEENLDI